MICEVDNQAKRRYTTRLLIAMALYVLALFVSLRAFRTLHPAHAVTVLLALLPALPILATIAILGLYLREERDEFQRQLLIQSLLWAMGATLAITSVWGFLEMFSAAPPMPAYYVFMIFWVAVGLAGIPLRFRYRSGDE